MGLLGAVRHGAECALADAEELTTICLRTPKEQKPIIPIFSLIGKNVFFFFFLGGGGGGR